MNPRAILLTIVAFLLGALAAGSIGVRVIREVGTDEDASSLPTTTTTSTVAGQIEPPTYQIDPYETIVASTSVIPLSVTVADGELAVAYEMVTLAPYEGVAPISFVGGFGAIVVIENEDLDHIWPRQWELETAEGVITGGPANPQARVARFDVGEGFAVADIEAVRITQALAPYPVQAEFALSSDFPSVEVYPGVTMRLRNVSDQGASHIVQVEVDEADHERTGFFVTGGGPGWRSAVFAAEGDPVVNLTWVGGELPDPIPLTAIGTVWVELDGGFALTLDGVL